MKSVIDPALASDPLFLDAVLKKYFSDPCEAGFTCLVRILHHLQSNKEALPGKIIDSYYRHVSEYRVNPIFLSHFVQILISFERPLEATYYAACWASLSQNSISKEYYAQCAATRRDYCTLLNIANLFSENEHDRYSFKLVAILYLITLGHFAEALEFSHAVLDAVALPNPSLTWPFGLLAILKVSLQTKDANLIEHLLRTAQQLNTEIPMNRGDQETIEEILKQKNTKEEGHE